MYPGNGQANRCVHFAGISPTALVMVVVLILISNSGETNDSSLHGLKESTSDSGIVISSSIFPDLIWVKIFIGNHANAQHSELLCQ